MVKSSIRALVFTLSMVMSFALQAGGIYHCSDRFGGYNFSDRPCPNMAKKNDSEAHEVWQMLKALVKEGRSMAANQQSSVESILACKDTQKQLLDKLAALRPRVDLVATRHEHLLSVYDQMNQCLDCRAAATYHCSRVDSKLDSALNQISVSR